MCSRDAKVDVELNSCHIPVIPFLSHATFLTHSDHSQQPGSLMLDWHRLFGTMMRDRCYQSCFEVELELDLSVAQQFLDCALLRRMDRLPEPDLPDGFAPLADFTLISFKSHQESLNQFAIEEHIGHSIAFRKFMDNHVSTPIDPEELLLLMVSVRYPATVLEKLPFTKQSDGVYTLQYGLTSLRLIVLHELPKTPRNAPLLFFSAKPEAVRYARGAFLPRNPNTGTGLLDEVLLKYKLEGFTMPYTEEDFIRDHLQSVLLRMTPEQKRNYLATLPFEERLKGVPAEERLKGVPAEELLKRVPAEERLKGVPAEERLKGLPIEEVLHGLSPERLAQLEALLLSRAGRGEG